MLRTRSAGRLRWESILPQEYLRLPAELGRVDALLDDERFFEPLRAWFRPSLGRPSTPIETYLRMMFLKFRYRLGYESLCAEVTDSICWHRFCRIDPDQPVPDPTTLMKLTKRCGDTAVAQLNEALLAKAVEAKLLRMGKVRADTTVVPANVQYPTDSGLLAKATGKISRIVRRIKADDAASRTTFRNRTRAAGRRARQIMSRLRLRAAQDRDQAQAAVYRIAGGSSDADRLPFGLNDRHDALLRLRVGVAGVLDSQFVDDLPRWVALDPVDDPAADHDGLERVVSGRYRQRHAGVAAQVAGLARAGAGEEDDVVAAGADVDGSGVRRAVREDGGQVSDRGAVEDAAYVGIKHENAPVSGDCRRAS